MISDHPLTHTFLDPADGPCDPTATPPERHWVAIPLIDAKDLLPDSWRPTRGGALERRARDRSSVTPVDFDLMHHGEIIMAAWCAQARDAVDDPTMAAELESCRLSHAMRVQVVAGLRSNARSSTSCTVGKLVHTSVAHMLTWIRRGEEHLRTSYLHLAATPHLRRRDILRRIVLPEQNFTLAVLNRVVRWSARESARLVRSA